VALSSLSEKNRLATRHLSRITRMWKQIVNQFSNFCNGNNTCMGNIILIKCIHVVLAMMGGHGNFAFNLVVKVSVALGYVLRL
jgi:hypothetical protein